MAEATSQPDVVSPRQGRIQREANRIAAAKVYVKAREKAGKSVPSFVRQLAAQER